MTVAVAAENGTMCAGHAARGDFRCADCGYGVTIHRTLPTCPMCRGELWEIWPVARASAPPVRLGVI
jgi:Zn finger protein HypA/HybF involved in hydrogenase expression